MARERSSAPARRSGTPLLVVVLLPLALVAAGLAIAVAVVANGSGHRATTKELDARAGTVKAAWQASGHPTAARDLQRLGTRLDATIAIRRGQTPNAGGTAVGDTRVYSYPVRGKRLLQISLATKASSDALSNGLVGAIIAGLAGVLLLVVLGSALVSAVAVAPVRALADALQRIHAGDHSARAPVKGAREVRAAAGAFNQVAERSAEVNAALGTDAVTGLPTAERVRQTLDLEIKRAAREMVPMALVLVDLDNFKAVNDAHGKQAGDRVLRAIADRLRPVVRATDLLGRIGGDEFGMVLPKANADHAEMILSRAREALAAVAGEGFTMSFSAGYAVYPADAREAGTLMQAAEGALRMATRRGSGSTQRFDPSEVTVAATEGERHEVIELLKSPDGIQPVFQPLVALATGQVSGYEALSRFKE